MEGGVSWSERPNIWKIQNDDSESGIPNSLDKGNYGNIKGTKDKFKGRPCKWFTIVYIHQFEPQNQKGQRPINDKRGGTMYFSCIEAHEKFFVLYYSFEIRDKVDEMERKEGE